MNNPQDHCPDQIKKDNSMQSGSAEIIENQIIVPEIYQMVLRLPQIKECQPGQFIQILTSNSTDPLLRRPISIADQNNDQIIIYYQVKGKGTNNLSSKRCGDYLDIVYPLGNGFPVIKDKNTPLSFVAGGIGLPPLFFYLKKYCQILPTETHFFYGCRNQASFINIETIQKFPINLYLATEIPSGYHFGYITDVLQNYLNKKKGKKIIFTCGPSAMLKALQKIVIQYSVDIKIYASLEDYMACGYGVCNGCVHPIFKNNQKVYQKVCTEGPVFDLKEVIWEI